MLEYLLEVLKMLNDRVEEHIEDSKNTFLIRNDILRSLRVTPVVALELARIIQAIDPRMEDSPEVFSCVVVHGSKVTLRDIKAATAHRYPTYASTVEMFILGSERSSEDPELIIVVAGSDEELSQLGRTVTTLIRFNHSTSN